MANCGKITAGILNNCDYDLVGGGKSSIILINMEDINGYTRNTSNPQIIEGISLVTSPVAKGFKFEGFKSSVEETRTLVANNFKNYWNHGFVFRVFDNSPETKKQIDLLKNATVTAIYENNNQGVNGNAAFEYYGITQGLVVTVAESAKNDAATQGAYVITLSSPEVKEPKLPATIYLTDYVTTKALVASLI